jgi:hypothetical protein
MDYGFLAIAGLVFLLNDGLAVGSFVLLYDWPVAIMRLANRDASAARPGMNSNVVGKGWRGNANHNGSSNQIFLHVSLLHLWGYRSEHRRSAACSEDNAGSAASLSRAYGTALDDTRQGG